MSQKRILLVDDEPSILIVLRAVIEQAGYTVDVAEDGFAALRKIQRAKPDLIITDLRMPNMNGFELLSVIRSRFPELPTIAISGEFVAVDLQVGPLADAFFEKGHYDIADFLARISALLSSPPQRPARSHPPLWKPTGNASLMLTCTACLRSFPVELCEGAAPLNRTTCIVCGADLDVELVAIGMTRSKAAD